MTLSQLLMTEPLGNDYHNKKLLKKYDKEFSLLLTSEVKYEDLLFNILNNEVFSYSQRDYHIPFYLPIKNLEKYHNTNIETEYFDLKYSKKENSRIEMFMNFLNWSDKNIDYMYEINKTSLMEKLMIRLLEYNHEKFNNLFLNNGFIKTKLENLDEEYRIKLFESIINNWTTIWNKKNEDNMKEHYLYSKWTSAFPLFETLYILSKDLEGSKIENLKNNINYQNMLNMLKDFDSVEKIKQIYDYQFSIYLDNSIELKEDNKKRKKI